MIPEKYKTPITKESLAELVRCNPYKVIVRILQVVHRNQTETEKSLRACRVVNGVGFSKPDARLGTECIDLIAKYRTLPKTHLSIWLLPDKSGYPRIVKYWKQVEQSRKEKLSRLIKQYHGV